MNTIRQRIEEEIIKLIKSRNDEGDGLVSYATKEAVDQIISTILESLKEKKGKRIPVQCLRPDCAVAHYTYEPEIVGYNQAIKDFRKTLGEE